MLSFSFSFVSFFFLLSSSAVMSHSYISALHRPQGGKDASGAFGTRLTSTPAGRVQNTGIIQSKEINSGHICGRILGGNEVPSGFVDVAKEFERAEAEGLALTSSDGTVDMEVFINGPDGSGPWNCQSSSDLTLKVLEPMSIKLQLPGVKGIDNSLKTTYRPLRAVFSKDAVCGAGKHKDACVVRCKNQLGFGSCIAIRLQRSASAKPAHILPIMH